MKKLLANITVALFFVLWNVADFLIEIYYTLNPNKYNS